MTAEALAAALTAERDAETLWRYLRTVTEDAQQAEEDARITTIRARNHRIAIEKENHA